MLLRRVPTLLLAALVAAVVAACGGSSGSSDNGVASKSPQDIVSAATKAINGVQAVHVSGSMVSGSAPITLDLNLVSGKGAKGQMSQNGKSFQLMSDGQWVYINAGPAFWRQIGGTAAAQLLQGKWLKAPANSGNFASLAQLTDVHKLLSTLVDNHGAQLTKGSATTVHGQKVIAVRDTTNHGTLYVATTGKAYPVQVSKSGTGGGSITFDRFNESVSLTPPSNAIDVSSLKSK